MEKPLKYQNSKTGTFNMQKNFFLRWDQFNFLLEGDKGISKEKLQKPHEYKSFVFRGFIMRYIKENWDRFDPIKFEEWRYKIEINKNKNKKKN